jgi:hypothetical protein
MIHPSINESFRQVPLSRAARIFETDREQASLFHGTVLKLLKTGQRLSRTYENIPFDVRKVISSLTTNSCDIGICGLYTLRLGRIWIPTHVSPVTPLRTLARVLGTMAHETGHALQNRFYDAARTASEQQREPYALTFIHKFIDMPNPRTYCGIESIHHVR